MQAAQSLLGEALAVRRSPLMVGDGCDQQFAVYGKGYGLEGWGVGHGRDAKGG